MTSNKKVLLTVCRPNGTLCSICGRSFEEGESICAGGHEIGLEYELPKNKTTK